METKVIHSATKQRVLSDSIFVLSVAAASYFIAEFRLYLNAEYPEATLSSLLSGSAARPFQYRALVPWIVKWISTANLPVPPIHLPPQLWITTSLPIDRARSFVLIEMLSLFSLAVAFRYYVSLFFKNHTLSSLLSFSLFLVLPFNYLLPRTPSVWYPYDFPAILFFTLGLIALYKENWPMYYAVFVIGALNRETICFLTFIFLFSSIGKRNHISVMLHCVAQFALWGMIKYLLYQLYTNNPGPEFFETKLMTNIDFLITPKRYPLLLANMGFILIPVLFYHRLVEEEFVKRSLLVVFPFFLGMMLVANIGELRIYGELIPVVLVAFLLILKQLIVREPATA